MTNNEQNRKALAAKVHERKVRGNNTQMYILPSRFLLR